MLPTPTAAVATGTRYSPTSGVTLTDAVNPSRWGRYAGAIARHEHTLGRPAPEPTDDRGRLSPRFVEWMMMLPDGWVTDLVPDGISRTQALRMLGNGVVPAQGASAIRELLGRARGSTPTP